MPRKTKTANAAQASFSTSSLTFSVGLGLRPRCARPLLSGFQLAEYKGFN